MRLHGIDPGQALGWAFWGPSSVKPFVRLENVKGRTEGHTYLRVRNFLKGVVQAGDRIAVEAPVLPEGVSIQSRLVLFGIRAEVLAIGAELGCVVFEPTSSEWRSWFLGVTTAPRTTPKKARRAWIKARAQQEVQDRGWGDVGPDEADAIGILDWLRQKVDHDYAANSTPLFRTRA